MSQTIFNSEVVRRYILSGAKYVATIRECRVYWDRVGRGVVLKLGDWRLRGRIVKVVGVEEADKFVAVSGFRTVEEWLNEAKRLHGVGDLDGLCIVVVELDTGLGASTRAIS